MINLLPYNYRLAKRREYRHRLWLIIGMFFLATLLLQMIGFLPVYVLAKNQQLEIGILEKEVKDLADSRAGSSIGREIAELNQLVQKISNLEEDRLSEYLKTISVAIVPGVLVGRVGYVNNEKKGVQENGKVLSISGVAESREKLQQFAKNLSETPIFGEVFLPPSLLTKKEAISFVLPVPIAEIKSTP